LRGQAYLRLGRGQDAALEFRKILGHKGASFGQVYALARPALARAYALAGDKNASRQTYEEFFALWKNADAGLAVLNRAHAEFATQQKY
jgi:eukaryotic-like serine/threonine-protein kinase